MGQVTIYLNEEAEQRMRQAASASGMSLSRWVAELVMQRSSQCWPEEVKKLAGAWSDFPEPEELRKGLGEDIPRETL